MKRLTVGILGILLLSLLSARFASADEKVFKGEVTDEQLNCAQTPMKAPPELTNKEACVLYWAHSAKPDGKFVLYDGATKTTYQLDDQKLVEPFVGAKVKINGEMEPGGKTIHVKSINTDSEAYH